MLAAPKAVSIPLVAGIRYRVGSFKGQVVPGEEMQIDKDQGMVKLTNQRLIFAGPIATSVSGYFQNYSHHFQTPIAQISSLVFQTARNHLALSFHPKMAMPSPTFLPLPSTPMKMASPPPSKQ